MSTHERKNSEFAIVLRRLLDETGIFNRKEWAEFLGITTSAISQWLHDDTMPRPELLRMIVGIVKRSDGVPREVLEAFEAMASKPAEQVFPPGRRIEGSINDYLLSPLLNGFMRDLQRLRPAEQEKLLLRASEECAVIAGIIRRPWDFPNQRASSGMAAEDNEAINNGARTRSNMGADPLRDHAWPQPEQSYLPKPAWEAAEEVIYSLGERANLLFDQVTKYLTGTADESLRPVARTFCLHALAHVRAQNHNAPLMIMQHIIRSMAVSISNFTNLQRMTEALNALFLTDEKTAILVKQGDGDFVSLEYSADNFGEDLETSVRALSPFDLQYIPADHNFSYKRVRIDESGTLVPA